VHVPLPEQLPRVDIVPMYAGVDDYALLAALERGARGLVIAGVGAGNVNETLYRGILGALDTGVPVVISSRVPFGGVRPIYAYAGGGVALLKAGAIFAQDLNPQKARVLLMAGLGAGYGWTELAGLFGS
jgi:L-asparaginase